MTTNDVVHRAPSLEAYEISREDLYEQVWATPINHLAEKFGVSGSYLARVCEALNVPRPPVGYWQKKAVGKAKPRPELPAALPGDQLAWSKDKPLAVPAKTRVRRKRVGTAMTNTVRSGRHPMLIGVEGHFRKSRSVEEGEFLRPYKYLLPDIVASEAFLIRALDLANEVYTAFDKKGHRVLFAPPDQRMGRGVDWVENWQETAKSSISGMIPAIVRKLDGAKDELQALMTAAEKAEAQRLREWEEAHERYLREEDQRRVEQAMSESQKQLSDIMDGWAVAMSVERFFQDAERRLGDVESERRAQLVDVSLWRELCSARWIPWIILKAGWPPRSGTSRNTVRIRPSAIRTCDGVC